MSYESFSSKPSVKPVFTMHGVNRIELPDKRTSVKPGSLPIYTGKAKNLHSYKFQGLKLIENCLIQVHIHLTIMRKCIQLIFMTGPMIPTIMILTTTTITVVMLIRVKMEPKASILVNMARLHTFKNSRFGNDNRNLFSSLLDDVLEN